MKGSVIWQRRRSTGRRYVWSDDPFYRMLFEFRREDADWLSNQGVSLDVIAVIGQGSHTRSTMTTPAVYNMLYWASNRKSECRINMELYWYFHSQTVPNSARLHCQDLWLEPMQRHVMAYLWFVRTTRIPIEVSPLCYLEQSGKR